MNKVDSKAPVSGFELRSLDNEENPFGFRDSFKLFVSYRTSAKLDEEARQKKIADDLKEAQKAELEKLNSGGAFPDAANPFVSYKGKSNSKEYDIQVETERLLSDASLNESCDPCEFQTIYKALEPLKLLSARSIDKEVRERNRKLYEVLAQKGNVRPLSRPAFPRVIDQLAQLDDMHPSFEDVTAFVRKHIMFSHKRGVPKGIPPALIVSLPGYGKSRYAADLAVTLCAPIHRISFDSAVTSSTLLGSDKNWGNSTSGVVFEAICASTEAVANPVLLLDEIDKCRSDSNHQDPLASLHSVLEPLTAKSATDISLGLTFDASFVTWIALANRLDLIAETIRSRFTIFQIKPATGWGAIRLARSVSNDAYMQWGSGFPEPHMDLIRLVYHLSPREQRKAWEMAYATAVTEGRLHLEPSDFQEWDTDQEKKQWTH
jgi:ATP-dependent Lon protease